MLIEIAIMLSSAIMWRLALTNSLGESLQPLPGPLQPDFAAQPFQDCCFKNHTYFHIPETGDFDQELEFFF